MNVPVMGETTPIQVPGRFAPETPHITPIGEEAAGTNIGAAQAKLGGTISGVSAELGAHIVAKQNQDQEQAANDQVTAFAKDAQENVLDKGVLALNGANAKGATVVYDKAVSDLENKYAEGLQPKTAELYHRIAQTHVNLWRNNVIQHELTQTAAADEQAVASNVVTSAQTYGQAYGVKISDPDAQSKHDADMNALLVKSRSETVDQLKRQGIIDPDSVRIALQRVDGKFATEAATANPDNAGNILHSGKMDLSDKDKDQLRGIQVDTLQNNITQAIASGSAKILNPDATPSLEKTLAFVDAQAKAQKFTPEQTAQAESQARSLISTKTAEINQNREQALRKFSDATLQAFNSGKGHDEMVNTFVKKDPSNFTGFPQTDTATKQAIVDKLFTDKQAAINDAMTHLNPGQKAAIAEAEIVVDGKVGTTNIKLAGMNKQQKAKDVYMNLIKQYVAGSNHTYKEIMQYTNDLSKDVGNGHFWNSTVPAYKAVEEQQQKEAIGNTPATPIDRVRVKINGKTGTIPIKSYKPDTMEKL